MKSNYKLFGMLLASLAISFGTMAQTMPAAQSLPYTQDFSLPAFGTLAATTTYPDGWQGWRLANAVPTNPARTSVPTADQAIKFGDAASTGSGCYNFDGKIGGYSTSFDHAICLAVNTTGKSNIKVTFDAITLRNTYDGITLSTGYQLELALQYRVGVTGSFTTIAYLPTAYNSGSVVNTSGTAGVNLVQGLNVVLPATCDNQAVVQIRWANKSISGSAGSRPSMAIDNVSVTEDLTLSNNADLTSLSVDEKVDNNFVPLTMFGAANYSYDYYLVNGNPIPVISGVKSHGGASTVVTQATSLTGTEAEKTAKIEVTAQDGTTKKTYSVKFIETDNVFQNGLKTSGTPAGWSQSGMFFGNSITDGNNKFEGSYYTRCLSASTASYLRLPQTNSVGTLRFYAKKIDTNVVGNFKVSKKINAGEWTVVQDLGDINNSTYQEFSVVVNETAADSMFVRIEITKNGDTYPSAAYYIDDVSYSASTSITTALNKSTNQLKAYVLNGQLMLMEGDIFNSIGVKVASVKPTNTITAVKLNRGIYIVKSKIGTQKIVLR